MPLRHLILVGLSCVLLISEGFAELRVATYNLNNYLIMDRRVADRWQPSYPKPESEKVIIRQIILENAPDILALQEMGTPGFLEELRADLANEGLDYAHAVHLSGPDPERHVALLSKVPPVEGENGEVFKLFIVHLKSKYTVHKKDPESQLRRTREAQACRNRIVERTFDIGVDRFLVAGDFNDHPDSGPLRRFYSRGELQLGDLVPAADSRGEVWTYFYERRGQYSLVDGFVVSPEMAPNIKAGRGYIVDTPGALDGSDHRMVYLDLNIN